MATLRLNSFAAYTFNPREELEGRALNITQYQWIQTRLALLAEEKLHWKYDTENITLSLQKQAELIGQILLLQEILIDSDSANAELVQSNSNSRD